MCIRDSYRPVYTTRSLPAARPAGSARHLVTGRQTARDRHRVTLGGGFDDASRRAATPHIHPDEPPREWTGNPTAADRARTAARHPAHDTGPVSYTHLTLPTSDLV